MSFALSLAADVVEVEAGATTPVGLTVVNRGETTDRFEVEIEGIDPEWRFVPVPIFAVEPGEERSEKLFLKPPRIPESVAGSYPFVVRVRSLESGEARTAQALLKLKPFHHLTMDILPKKGVVSPTTKRNDFRLALVNLGNAEHTLQLSAQDPDDRCAYEFESDQITLGPGQQREIEMVADPKQTPLLSSGRLIGFSVVARSLNERNVSATSQAQLEQRSLLSPATLVVGALLLAAVGGWWAMRPVPPSIDLAINPPHVVKGETVQIRWIAKNADHVHITVGEEDVYNGPPTGEAVTWTMKESGPIQIVGEASRDGQMGSKDTETLQVDEPVVAPLPEIASIAASPARVKVNTSFILRWTVKNATHVAIKPLTGVDNLPPEVNEQQITPDTTGSRTYTVVAFNADGKSVSKSVTVDVYDESDATILAFTATPTSVRETEGGHTTLSWQASGAERVELQLGTDPPKKVDATGSLDLTLLAKTQVTLTAYDAKGRKAVKKLGIDYVKAPTPPPDTDSTTNSGTTGAPPPDPDFPDSIPPPKPTTSGTPNGL